MSSGNWGTDGAGNWDALSGRKPVRPPPTDSKVEKWDRWISAIADEVTTIWLNRTVWNAVNEMIRSASLPPSHFFEFLAQTYATAQAAAIRRQAEIDTRVISLGTLLEEILQEPQRLSRQRYVSKFAWGTQYLGDQGFTEQFAPSDSDYADPDLIQRDQERLSESAERIKRYVDQHIAHYDRKRKPEDIPTFNGLDDAVDCLGGLLQRYLLLFRAVDLDPIAPIPQYDWLAPFRVPWLADRGNHPAT